jgi:hypothetical protein
MLRGLRPRGASGVTADAGRYRVVASGERSSGLTARGLDTLTPARSPLQVQTIQLAGNQGPGLPPPSGSVVF